MATVVLLCFSGSSTRGSNSAEDHLTTHSDTYRGQYPSCSNHTTHAVRLQQLRTTSIPLGKCTFKPQCGRKEREGEEEG